MIPSICTCVPLAWSPLPSDLPGELLSGKPHLQCPPPDRLLCSHPPRGRALRLQGQGHLYAPDLEPLDGHRGLESIESRDTRGSAPQQNSEYSVLSQNLCASQCLVTVIWALPPSPSLQPLPGPGQPVPSVLQVTDKAASGLSAGNILASRKPRREPIAPAQGSAYPWPDILGATI